MHNCFSKIVLTAFAGLVTVVLPPLSEGQKAANLKKVEPGKTPYFSSTPTRCEYSGKCVFVFKPVAAGYRLVVTYIYAQVPTYSTGAAIGAYLSLHASTSDPQAISDQLLVPIPMDVPGYPNQDFSSEYRTVSSPVSFYFEPGTVPEIDVNNSRTGSDRFGPLAGVTGYLVKVE